jgi:hypothetical protein
MTIKKAFYDLLFSGKKPIIGMIHLMGLPGSVHFNGSFQKTLELASEEMKVLVEAGFDAVLFQNTGDVPALEEGDEATVAFMTRVGLRLREICPVKLGVNVLMNGSKAAFAIAKAISADFIRIKVNTGVVSTSTGMVQANPHGVLEFRNSIAAQDITVLGDLFDRTSAPIGNFPLEILADLAIRHADVEGLVISGYDENDTKARLISLRSKLPSACLITGGGVNLRNLSEFLNLSDGIIIGSSIKIKDGFLDPIDPEKAKEFMENVIKLREEN